MSLINKMTMVRSRRFFPLPMHVTMDRTPTTPARQSTPAERTTEFMPDTPFSRNQAARTPDLNNFGSSIIQITGSPASLPAIQPRRRMNLSAINLRNLSREYLEDDQSDPTSRENNDLVPQRNPTPLPPLIVHHCVWVEDDQAVPNT